MHHLKTIEQNAQMFWFKQVWHLYAAICNYHLTSLKHWWDKKMEVAQKRWDEKFQHDIDYDSEDDESLCQRLFSALGKRKATKDIHPREYENVPV